MKHFAFVAKRITTLTVLVCCLQNAAILSHAATLVSGYVSGTWTPNGNPYVVTADCTVLSNQVLTIQPGVDVVSAPDTGFTVFGNINAIGTPENPIYFRRAGTSNYWNGFELAAKNNVTNRFYYCRFSGGLQTVNFEVYGHNQINVTEVNNCEFLNCYCGVTGSLTGRAGSATGAPEIHNCVFNGVNLACYFGAWIESFEQSPVFLNPHITGNLFNNVKYAVDIFGNATNTSRMVFANNTIVNAERGVWLEFGAKADIFLRNNIFSGTSNAIVIQEGSETASNTAFNCFFNNAVNFIGYPSIFGIPILNNQNGDPCDVYFNIFLNPRFLDTNQFLLTASSPCIDAGDPSIIDNCFELSRGTSISDIGASGGPDTCAWLTHGFSPVFTTAPMDQSSCVGSVATFKAIVQGSGPLNYHWYFNRTNVLAGETNAQLTLFNLQSNQAGLYSLNVSNAFGSVTSAPARLIVSDACSTMNLYAGLSITGMVGRTYVVEAATNLSASVWNAVATNTLTQPRWLFIDTNTPLTPARYFRVRLLP